MFFCDVCEQGLLFFEFAWPVLMFLVVVLVRNFVSPPVAQQTCESPLILAIYKLEIVL
jgi:hypothetical protein